MLPGLWKSGDTLDFVRSLLYVLYLHPTFSFFLVKEKLTRESRLREKERGQVFGKGRKVTIRIELKCSCLFIQLHLPSLVLQSLSPPSQFVPT